MNLLTNQEYLGILNLKYSNSGYSERLADNQDKINYKYS